MDHDMTLAWPTLGKEVRANFLEHLNPALCAEVKATLPLESIQSHAVVAGKQMYFPYRFIPLTEEIHYENMAEQPLGRMNVELDFQYMAINYGPMTEPVPALPVAQVVEEDMEKLMYIGEKVWHNLLFSDDYIRVLVTQGGGNNVS